MAEKKTREDIARYLNVSKVDTKEFELPETTFISDIDPKVFQGIVVECLSKIEGIELVEGGFISNFLGRGTSITGIQSEKDSRGHSVSIKVEVNIRYGLSIPQKAEEIQSKIVEEVTNFTGLHVASVHVMFRNIIPLDQNTQILNRLQQLQMQSGIEDEHYSDHF